MVASATHRIQADGGGTTDRGLLSRNSVCRPRGTLTIMRQSPFFVNVWIHQTHTPHFAKERFLRDCGHLDERHRVYAAVVAEADHHIGRILRALDDLGLAENTLVVFSSDNGPEGTARDPKNKKGGGGYGTYYSTGSTGGLKGRKRSLYEGGIRVPFIARWPGHIPAGKVNESTVITAVDLLPTFCAAAGVTLPGGYRPDGEDMLAALLGEDVRRTKPIFWEWTGHEDARWSLDAGKKLNWPRLGVREGKWKLLMTYDRQRLELYDVVEDGAEENNLAGTHPEVAERLANKVTAWKSTLPGKPPAHCLSSARTK